MEGKNKLINEILNLSNKIYVNYSNDKGYKLLEWFIEKYKLLDKANKNNKMVIYKYEIYWCNFGENIGSEENKIRPCVIIQNQAGNKHSSTTIVAPITNSTIELPISVQIHRESNPDITGTIDLGQIRTVSKGRLLGKISKLTTKESKLVDIAILKSLGLYKILADNEKMREEIKQLKNENRNLKYLLDNQENN